MKNHRVDKAFQKLNTHPSEIDAENVWDKLEPLLEPKRDGRKWLLFLLPIMAMVFFAILVLFTKPTHTEVMDLQSTLLESSNVRTEQNLVLSNDDLNSENIENNTTTNIQESFNSKKRLKIETVINTQKQAKEYDLKIVIGEESEFTQQKYPQNNDIESLDDSREQVVNNEVEYQELSNEKSTSTNNTSTSRELLGTTLLSGLQLAPLKYKSNEPSFKPEECPGFAKKSPALQLIAQPYAHYVFNNNSFGPNNEITDLYQLRDMHESGFYALDAGLEIIAETKYGVNLITGVNYSRTVDKFEFDIQKDTTFLLEDVIKDIFIDANMDSVIVIGDTLVNAIAIESNRLFNNYSTLDFPIGIEYFKPLGKFEIGISAVALVNITFNVEADAFAQEDEVVDVEPFYRDRLSLRYRFGIPIQYSFGPNLAIGLRPVYAYNPAPISIDAYEVEHRTSNFGIGFYTRFRF